MNPGILRFATAGSVDDGKSTLIGRLLWETGSIYEDEWDNVGRASAGSGTTAHDFSLVTDGLRAEREQNITIDTAYRYFHTSRRRFILADVPGHEQYTRNMATGASTADVVLLLVDAQKGPMRQTRRHAAIACAFGAREFIVAINKMDRVGLSEPAYERVREQCELMFESLGGGCRAYVPTCAVGGDNVTRVSARMPWYSGPSLLDCLESFSVPERGRGPFRFVVQAVMRAPDGSRWYGGRCAGRKIRSGERLTALPSHLSVGVLAIRLGDDRLQRAPAGASVAVCLDRDIDLGRGDLLAEPDLLPAIEAAFSAHALWVGREPCATPGSYLLQCASRSTACRVTRIRGCLNFDSGGMDEAHSIEENDFAEVEIVPEAPVMLDGFLVSSATGGCILIDPKSGETVAAVMAIAPLAQDSRVEPITAPVIWLTGLSSAGKTTIATALREWLMALGRRTEILDGDDIRRALGGDLGFSRADRQVQAQRLAFLAGLLSRHGVSVIVAAITPHRADREQARQQLGRFVEVFVNAPLTECERRDIHGVYRRARAREMFDVAGLDSPYEAPVSPEVECFTDREVVSGCVDKIMQALHKMA